MTIVTLSWSGDVAYGPRGARYEITPFSGLYDCRVYTDSTPLGTVIANKEGTREGAMLAAQRHAEALTAEYGAESDAINGASDRPRIPIGPVLG